MLARVHRSTATPREPDGRSLTRRSLLGGSALVGAALLAGCTSAASPEPTGSAAPEPDGDPDGQVRRGVADDEAALIALYDAVLIAYPGLAADLTSLRDEHLAHAEAMGIPATSPPTAGDVGSQPQALAALVDAEQAAVAQRTASCEASAGADVARTIALIAASEAGHAEFLRNLT